VPELINTLDRLGAAPAESEAVFREAIDLARQAGDLGAEARVEAAYGWLKTGHNEWPTVIDHAQRALTLADAAADRPIQLFARFALGRALFWQGRSHEAVRVFDQTAEIGGDAGAEVELLGWRPYIECLSIRAVAHSFMGQPRKGLDFVEGLPALTRRHGLHSDLSSIASDRIWTSYILGDADRARRFSSEALQAAERFGADRNVVYALLACGHASCLALRWEEGDGFFARARERIAATGAGREWTMAINGPQALCRAGMGDRERGLDLARKGVELTLANELDLLRVIQGAFCVRVLRIAGGPSHQDELETRIAETLELVQRTGLAGWLPLVLLERAGLARMRGDADGLRRDLAEARRLFAKMGVTGWDDYARSIEA